jgi:hypothetical protein
MNNDNEYVDENGTTWNQPTAYAYAMACKALEREKQKKPLYRQLTPEQRHEAMREPMREIAEHYVKVLFEGAGKPEALAFTPDILTKTFDIIMTQLLDALFSETEKTT